MTLFLHYAFLQNALVAGSFIAVAAAVIGYFLLIRELTFAGHALSHIGFAGAAGALVVGVDPIFGMLFFTSLASVGIGFFAKRLRERDVTIGVLMTLLLGLGALFLSLYSGYAERAYSILFGTILGINRGDIVLTAVFCGLTVLAISVLFRPLLFSSLDPEVAEARGVPLRAFGIFFLLLVAVTVTVSVQVVGVLLIFTLLVGPAATAARLTIRPLHTIVMAIALSLIYTWLGIFLATNSTWPVSFFIATLSFGTYVFVRVTSKLYV